VRRNSLKITAKRPYSFDKPLYHDVTLVERFGVLWPFGGAKRNQSQERNVPVKKIKPIRFTTTAVDAPMVAAGITHSLLSKAKVYSWNELEEKLAAGDPFVTDIVSRVDFTDEQKEIMESNATVVRMVRAKMGDKPTVKLVFCSECKVPLALTVGTVPTNCLLTDNCPGKYLATPKAAAA